jgi:hypothetical protein
MKRKTPQKKPKRHCAVTLVAPVHLLGFSEDASAIS